MNNAPHTKTLWIKPEYLTQILAGRKTVEVRAAYSNIVRLRPGDRLKLNDAFLFEIVRVSRYASLIELLAHEESAAIAPDLSPTQLLQAVEALYPPKKQALGLVALEIRPLEDAALTEF